MDLPARRRADRQRRTWSTTIPRSTPSPYAFRPERFLDTKPGTYTWIPFGGGRRRCIGASFALLEMRIVLRAAAERFTIATAGPPQRPRRRMITITPGDGARVRLGRRARWSGSHAPAAGQAVNV